MCIRDSSWPHALDTIYGGAVTISEQVAAMSGGRFTIEPFAAGELVPGLQVLDAVQNGAVECGHTASYYYVGKNPALAFGTAVPFGLTPQQQNTWLYEGGGNDALNRIYADFGVRSFPAGNNRTPDGGLVQAPAGWARITEGAEDAHPWPRGQGDGLPGRECSGAARW